MYTATYGGDALYDPRDQSLQLYDVELRSFMDEADELTFSVPATHPLAGTFAVMGRSKEASLMDGGEEVFRGRVRRVSRDFLNCEKVECESMRAYLNDATVPPHTTGEPEEGSEAERVGATVGELFSWYIAQYNLRVPQAQRMHLGVVDGERVHGGEVSVSEASRVKAWEAIKRNIVDAYGGYVRVRREGGLMYVDLLADGTEETAQRIEFGVNMLDLTGEEDGTSFATRIVPVGTTVEVSHEEPKVDEEGNPVYGEDGTQETEKVVDVEAGQPVHIWSYADTGLPNGCYKMGDAVINGVAELSMGVIEDSREYDLSTPAELVDAALRDLATSCFGDTVEVKAVDMHLADGGVPAIRVGQYVRAVSGPHGLDAWFLCRERTLHPGDPARDTYVLGTDAGTLTGAQARRLSELNASVGEGVEIARGSDRKAAQSAVAAGEAKSEAAAAGAKAESAGAKADSADAKAVAASAKADSADAKADSAGAKAEQASSDVAQAKADAKSVKDWADEFKKTSDSIVYDQQLTDRMDEFSRTMSATYTSKDELGTTLKEYTRTEQLADAVRTTVSSELTDADGKEKYTLRSTFEQTSEGFTARLDTVSGKANDANVLATAAATTASTANTNAKTAKSAAADAAKTATNYLGFSANGLVVGDMTADTLGSNTRIRSDGIDLRDGEETVSSFEKNAVVLGSNSRDTHVWMGANDNPSVQGARGFADIYTDGNSLFLLADGPVQILPYLAGSDMGLVIMPNDVYIGIGTKRLRISKAGNLYNASVQADNVSVSCRHGSFGVAAGTLQLDGLAACSYDADWVAGVHVRRFGGVVVLDFAMTLPNGIDAGTAHVVGTLAAGFRPVGTVARGALVTSTRDDAHAFVRPSGEVGIYTHQGVDAPANVNGQVVFFAQQ